MAAALLAVLSEILVGAINPFIEQFNLSFFFVGVIIIPTIGNLAEHLVSVQLAAKDKMEFALAVTFGSSLQVALFVAPVLVLLGAVMGQDMDLVFTPLEIAAVAAAVGISSLIAIDGETNWLEGALLTLVYAILAVSFFEFVPATAGQVAGAATARRGSAPPPGSFAGQAATPAVASSSVVLLVVVRARLERRLGDRLGGRRLAERLGLGHERIGGLLRPRSPSSVAPTASRRARRRPRSSSGGHPCRRPTTGSGAGPRWRPAGPCRGIARRSRPGGPTRRPSGTPTSPCHRR